MRTSIDIPDELLKRAKLTAVERGTTLREIVTEALEQELTRGDRPVPRRRVIFPLAKSRKPGSLRLSNADIADFEINADAAR